MLDIRLDHAGTFEDALRNGERLVAYGIGPAADALALAVREADAEIPFGYDEQPGAARFPKSRAVAEYTASVLRISGSGIERTTLNGVDSTFPNVQPLPDGEILLVGSRAARHRDGTHDLNAKVFGSDGKLRREFLLGDGIEDVQATADGRIWVSYFDEGIFGNFGWGEPGGPEPVGSPGLIRWRADGTLEWRYEAPAGLDDIADCYALNVADDAVWACYYTDFPLVRIAHDDSIAGWTTPVAGARVLAIGGKWAAFYGGYRNEQHLCVLLEFDGNELAERARVELSLPSGAPISGQAVFGRGPFLHVFDGPHWYRFDVRSAGRV